MSNTDHLKMYRAPSGQLVSMDTYVKEWREIGEEVAKELGLDLYGFDPDLVLVRKSGSVINVPLEAAQAIVRLRRRKQRMTDCNCDTCLLRRALERTVEEHKELRAELAAHRREQRQVQDDDDFFAPSVPPKRGDLVEVLNDSNKWVPGTISKVIDGRVLGMTANRPITSFSHKISSYLVSWRYE